MRAQKVAVFRRVAHLPYEPIYQPQCAADAAVEAAMRTAIVILATIVAISALAQPGRCGSKSKPSRFANRSSGVRKTPGRISSAVATPLIMIAPAVIAVKILAFMVSSPLFQFFYPNIAPFDFQNIGTLVQLRRLEGTLSKADKCGFGKGRKFVRTRFWQAHLAPLSSCLSKILLSHHNYFVCSWPFLGYSDPSLSVRSESVAFTALSNDVTLP